MSTCQTIITSAYRRAGIRAAGVSPSNTQNTVGMERLVDFYHDLFASGALGRANDVYLTSGSTYTALEFERITCADDTCVVTVPDVYYTGQTLIDPYDYSFEGSGQPFTYTTNGTPRVPVDGATIQIINSTAPGSLISQIWDTMGGGWQQIEGLTLTSFAPFSGKYEEGLKNALAVFLADEGGYQVRPLLARAAARFKLSIGSRYDGPRRTIKQRSNYF